MLRFVKIIAILALAPALHAAQAINSLTLTGNSTFSGNLTQSGAETFLSGAQAAFAAGSTLTINGTFSGAPSGGTFNFGNMTVVGISGTLPNTTGNAGKFVTNNGTAASWSLVNLGSSVTGTLPVANGGTGTTTPGIVAGANVTVTGTWPNQTVSAAGNGTVTMVGISSANGISGTVVNASTTPIIGLTLGAITPTSVNGITLSGTGSALTIASGKTLTASNTLTFAGTDGSTLNVGAGGTLGSAAYTASSAYEVPLTFSTGLTRTTNTITTNAVNLAAAGSGGVTGTLPVANGGTGTTSPSLVAGSNITITGTWPNQTVTASGSGAGNVTGPGSSTANAIVRWNSTAGTAVLNSAVTIADTTGAMTWAASQNATLTAGSTGAVLNLGQGANGSVSITPTGTGVIALLGTTPSTSSTTGAVQIAGGLGVVGNVTTGGIVTSATLVTTGNITGGNVTYSTSDLRMGIDNNALIAGEGIKASSNTRASFQADTYSATSAGFLAWRRARGTWASPSALQAGDLVGRFLTRGYLATGWATTNGAQLSVFANQNYTDTAQGTYITFDTTADNSTSVLERVRVTASGNLLIGTTSEAGLAGSGALSVNGSIVAGGVIGSSGGFKRVTSQFDKTTDTTLADVTGLSVALVAAGTYTFTARLHITANATGGQKVAIAVSSAPTAIIYQINSVDNSSGANVINARQTTSGGATGVAGGTSYYTWIEGTVVANAAANLTVQFAENAASGTSSVLAGSELQVLKM